VGSFQIGSNTASVFWDTDELADGEVQYGPTLSYGSSLTSPFPAISRILSLVGLVPSTLYHYRVLSKDAAGNLATSGDFTFTTAAGSTCNPPVDCSPPFPGCTFPSATSCDCGPMVCVQQPQPPSFMVEPQNVTVAVGQPASFNVLAFGDLPLSYQWQSKASTASSFTNIAGATVDTFNIASAALSANGTQYRCRVSNSTGTVTSAAGTLTVISGATLPTITQQPQNQSAFPGQTVSFVVGATGTQPLTYLWQIAAPGAPAFSDFPFATSSTFTVTVDPSLNGYRYRAVVSNVAGSVTSNTATLTLAGTACDLNRDTFTNVVDVQLEVNMALNVIACSGDINMDFVCNVLDVQRVVNAALGGQCVSP
jgi:hypothetical protein